MVNFMPSDIIGGATSKYQIIGEKVMSSNGTFITPIYSIKNFKSNEELENYLEFKINEVINLHIGIWNIIKIEKEITPISAYAEISIIMN